MPKFRPCTDSAIAQMSRIMPDVEKNHFDLPMKSNVIGFESRAPSAARERSRRVPRSEYRIACVATTAVNSERMTPTPRVSAKPFTPAVARMNRMNATRTVTMFASMIAVRPFLYPWAIACPTLRPARISSFTRSKITMLASAATPSVRINPARPGSVSTIGSSSTIA